MLDLRSGGWVLLAAIALMGVVVVWQLFAVIPTLRRPATGDGTNVATYGFDLSHCLVDRDAILATGLPKDGLPALTQPTVIAGRDVSPDRKLNGVRKLLGSERVIGVSINGEARAYPLWILDWHEVVNDTLGGEPILVTFSPLCDGVVVFDRRLGGQECEFGVSGLLYNSNLVFYDRRSSPAAESLWSQLAMRAIAGPAAAAGAALRPLPAALVPWRDWLARHPETTVILPNPARYKLYRRDAYSSYFGSEKLHYPVAPLPPRNDDGLSYKTRIVARLRDGEWRLQRAVHSGEWPNSDDRAVVHALWFAWYATRPDARVP
jgi:hypothetical protein